MKLKLMDRLMISGALASTLLAASVYATETQCEARGPKIDPAQRFEYIFNQLELTAEQRTEVLAVMAQLHEERRAQMQAERDASEMPQERPNREEMAAKMAAERAEMLVELTDQLNTILLAEDSAALVEYLEFHRPKMRKGDGHHSSDGKPTKPCMSESSTTQSSSE